MPKTFTFNLCGDVSAKLDQVREAAMRESVEFRGDPSKGTFEGRISGTYRVEGGCILIEVTSAPRLVPWSVIENRLRGVIAG